jgi:hypothetical protein
MKVNCWEYKRCGREPGGKNAGKAGVCPAVTSERLHGTHGGKNSGRVCWVVAGTMCGGAVEGSFAKKYDDCRACDFYRLVEDEEGSNFLITIDLLRSLKDKK